MYVQINIKKFEMGREISSYIPLPDHPQRTRKHAHCCNVLNLEDITFPVSITEILKFEKESYFVKICQFMNNSN